MEYKLTSSGRKQATTTNLYYSGVVAAKEPFCKTMVRHIPAPKCEIMRITYNHLRIQKKLAKC